MMMDQRNMGSRNRKEVRRRMKGGKKEEEGQEE